MICNTCNLPFDESDLSQVFEHEHKGIKTAENVGKKVIHHAREIFPTASIQFSMGVHNFMKGDYDMRTFYQESTDFKAGYYQAMELNLDKTHVLKN